MSFLSSMAAVVAVCWCMAAIWYWRRAKYPISFGLGGCFVVLTGCAVGYDFFHIGFGPIPLTIDRALLGALVVGFLLCVLHGRERLKPWDRTDLIVLGLVGVLTVSTLTHDFGYRNNLPLSRLLFFNLLPVGLYFIVKNAELKAEQLKPVVLGFVALGVYLSVTAIGEWRSWSFLVYPNYILDSSFHEFLGRARGPLLNPVANGILVATSLTMLFISWPHVRLRGRAVIVMVAPLMLIAIYATLTRSVWAGMFLVIGTLLWIPFSSRVRGVLVMSAALGVVLFVGGAGDLVKSFKRDKEVSVAEMEQSAGLRSVFAEIAGTMFQDRPIWGCGFGQYPRSKYDYLDSANTTAQLDKAIPYMQHNIFLSYLTETGMIGVIVLAVLYANFGWVGWRLWTSPFHSLLARQFGLVLLTLVINFMANGMFHDLTIIPMTNMLLFFVAGVGSNLYRQSQEKTVLERAYTLAIDQGDVELKKGIDRSENRAA